MTERKTYVCDYCGAEYNNPTACSECESDHAKASKIVKSTYAKFASTPNRIVVELEDGRLVDYERYGVPYLPPQEPESDNRKEDPECQKE